MYCTSCCTKYIEAWEEILHYDCKKECVQVNRTKERTLRE